MGKLDRRIAIVTSASLAIGEEIARLFAREGAHVVCAARTLNEGAPGCHERNSPPFSS